MSDKVATTQVAIDTTISRRWSPRAFKASKPVERDQLLALLEAARWAPSCFGEEPWRYIIFDRFDNETTWQMMLGCLTERNQLWARNAPLLIVATSVRIFSHNGKPDRWNQYDTGAASENICLQATSMGLGAHQMGGFDGDKVRVTFGVPEDVDVMAVIAVGHPGDLNDLHENFRAEEISERARKPISERFYRAAWGKAFS